MPLEDPRKETDLDTKEMQACCGPCCGYRCSSLHWHSPHDGWDRRGPGNWGVAGTYASSFGMFPLDFSYLTILVLLPPLQAILGFPSFSRGTGAL